MEKGWCRAMAELLIKTPFSSESGTKLSVLNQQPGVRWSSGWGTCLGWNQDQDASSPPPWALSPAAPAASGRSCRGRDCECSGGANYLHAKYQREIAMKATMLISTKKLKSEILYFWVERKQSVSPCTEDGVSIRDLLLQDLISYGVSHSKLKRLLQIKSLPN